MQAVIATHRPYRGVGSQPAGRYVGGSLVVLLHLLLIYAFATSLGYSIVPHMPAPIQTTSVDERKPVKIFPPPAEPVMQHYRVTVPADLPPINFAPTENTLTATLSPAQKQPAGEQVAVLPPGLPVRVEPAIDRSAGGDPVYPAVSRRLGEEGSVVLRVLVGPDGAVRQVEVQQTSGSPRLDAAAVDGARTRIHFRPGSLDGKPAEMWFTYRYRFELK